MANDQPISVTATDKQGDRELSLSLPSAQDQTEGRLIALFERHAKEAMDQYRYFGTLRALITWLPALIVLSVLGAISAKLGNTNCWVFLIQSAALILTLFTIFVAQRYLQRVQYRARLIAELAEQRLISILKGNRKIRHSTYHDLIMEVRNESMPEDIDIPASLRTFRWDTSSKALSIFFSLIALTFIAVTAIQGTCDVGALINTPFAWFSGLFA